MSKNSLRAFSGDAIRAYAVGASALLVIVSVAACGGQRSVSLPTTSAPTAPPASPTTPPTASVPTGGTAEAAYTRYWTVLTQAEHTQNLDQRRQILAQSAAEPLLSDVLSNINKMHAQDETSSGYVVVHVKKTEAAGTRTQIWDCQDATHAVLKNAKTGEVTSRGAAHYYLRASLAHGTDGQWRLTKIVPLNGRC